jgi:hypothetical protein
LSNENFGIIIVDPIDPRLVPEPYEGLGVSPYDEDDLSETFKEATD